MCKNRTKTLSVYETFEFISQAPFSRNLPEEALESDERKPAKEEAEVPTVEPGRGRQAMGPRRPPSAGPGHTPPGDRCTGMFSQTADQPSAPEVKGGGKGACFLSPSVLSRNVCVLANACTTFLVFFFFKESTPAPGECGTSLRPAASLPRRPSGHAFLLEEESGTREGCPLGKVNPPPCLSVGRWHAQGGGLQRPLPRECTLHPDLDSQPLHSHGHRPPRSLA